jgi:hypothetical protein
MKTLNVLEDFRALYVPGQRYSSSATKWLAQAILPDAIKTGVGTACDEKLSSSYYNEVNTIVGICNLLDPSMLQRWALTGLY